MHTVSGPWRLFLTTSGSDSSYRPFQSISTQEISTLTYVSVIVVQWLRYPRCVVILIDKQVQSNLKLQQMSFVLSLLVWRSHETWPTLYHSVTKDAFTHSWLLYWCWVHSHESQWLYYMFLNIELRVSFTLGKLTFPDSAKSPAPIFLLCFVLTFFAFRKHDIIM